MHAHPAECCSTRIPHLEFAPLLDLLTQPLEELAEGLGRLDATLRAREESVRQLSLEQIDFVIESRCPRLERIRHAIRQVELHLRRTVLAM